MGAIGKVSSHGTYGFGVDDRKIRSQDVLYFLIVALLLGLYDIPQQIKTQDYYSILAHLERYIYMGKEDYRKLKVIGIKFQLNIVSLAGIYGKEA